MNNEKLIKLPKQVEEITSQLETIVQEMNEPYHYYVGENQRYKKPSEAFEEWKKHKQPTIIHIYKGEYKDKISYYGQCNCSFVGEDKHNVIWKQTNGYYADCPLNIQGNLKIKGITFIADHSENPNYVWVDSTSGGYALHVDQEGVTGKVTIEDCIIISYQNAGLGSGTRANQTIELINTDCFNYSDSANTNGVSNGAILYHTSSNANDYINQKLILKNVKCHGENGRAIEFWGYGTYDYIVPIECVNVNCSSNNQTLTSDSLVRVLYNSMRVAFTDNSFGNNVGKLNSSKNKSQSSQITSDKGSAIDVTDFDNVEMFQFFRGNGASGCLNTPVKGWCIGVSYPYDIGSSGKSTFQVQYAWDILNKFIKYKRYKETTGYTPWVRCDETGMLRDVSLVETIITDCNAMTTRYAKINKASGGLNCPTSSGWYLIEEIKLENSTFILQKAYAVQDGFKEYRRYKETTSWTEWVLK